MPSSTGVMLSFGVVRSKEIARHRGLNHKAPSQVKGRSTSRVVGLARIPCVQVVRSIWHKSAHRVYEYECMLFGALAQDQHMVFPQSGHNIPRRFRNPRTLGNKSTANYCKFQAVYRKRWRCGCRLQS